jgi:hypothetical protein
MAWYYKNGEQVSGPYQPAELKQAVTQGIVTAATQVRQGENGVWYPASQIPGLLTPLVTPNFNANQVGQAVDKAYSATKIFAENSTWKTGLFRFAQLLVVAFENVFLLYGLSCWMTDISDIVHSTRMTDDPINAFYLMTQAGAVVFFHTRFGFGALLGSLVIAAMCIAVLEIAVSTGRMVDYLRK